MKTDKRDTQLYNALIIRVVDGDTVEAEIDLGFDIRFRHMLRILDIDTPETWRPKSNAEAEHGKEATIRAVELLEGRNVTIITHKKGKYGRYLAEIILEDGSDYATLMINEGFQKRKDYV